MPRLLKAFFLGLYFSLTVFSSEKELLEDSFRGRVEVGSFDQQQMWKPIPSGNTFVHLSPLFDSSPVPPKAKTWSVGMEDKRFSPRHLIVRVGDRVSFKNLDDFNHNVFSLSKGLTFDLGSYGSGLSRDVLTKEPGIVRVYCNVHASMAFFLLVSDTPWATLTDGHGNFEIQNLPEGEYQLHLWHWKGYRTSTLKWSKASKEEVFRLDVSGYRPQEHKNKFGLRYPPEDDDEEIY